MCGTVPKPRAKLQKTCIENYENFVKGGDFGVCGVDLPLGTCYYVDTTPMWGIAILYHNQGELIMLYLPREEGQGLVEYALILVLVAVVVIVILALMGPAIGNIFSNIVNTL